MGAIMGAQISESDRNGPERLTYAIRIMPGQRGFQASGETGRKRLTAAHNPEVAGSSLYAQSDLRPSSATGQRTRR